MTPHDNLGALYAKSMEHFGCGVAMFQPVSTADMRPPCIGYLDADRRWNLIANIEWRHEDALQHEHTEREDGLKLLKRAPRKQEDLGIEWRPRTSIGVRQLVVDASGQTLTNGLPVGADTHIKYRSYAKFGAVLITQKPITLTSYNDETLFHSWLAANKARLSSLYGTELRRYGARIVTRTYTCPYCSINAWDSKDKEANVSVKVKAHMLGDLGGELDWTERVTDKDWSHYYGQNKGDTVVVFFDGIEVPASTWWWEGLRGKLGKGDIGRRRNELIGSSPQSWEQRDSRARSPEDTTRDQHVEEKGLLTDDLWGSSTPLRRASPVHTPSTSRGRQPSSNRERGLSRSMSTPKRLSKYLDNDRKSASSKPRIGHVLPGPETDNKHLPPRPRTRFAEPEPQHQRFSTASTATSSSSARMWKTTVIDTEISPPASVLRSSLQKKTAPHSL